MTAIFFTALQVCIDVFVFRTRVFALSLFSHPSVLYLFYECFTCIYYTSRARVYLVVPSLNIIYSPGCEKLVFSVIGSYLTY